MKRISPIVKGTGIEAESKLVQGRPLLKKLLSIFSANALMSCNFHSRELVVCRRRVNMIRQVCSQQECQQYIEQLTRACD